MNKFLVEFFHPFYVLTGMLLLEIREKACVLSGPGTFSRAAYEITDRALPEERIR